MYLSRTNNTRTIAEIIHRQVGGTLVSLELEKPDPENYQATVQQVTEENETGYLPPLKSEAPTLKGEIQAPTLKGEIQAPALKWEIQ